jgi:ribosomal protein L11 methylase PrmA
MRNNQTKKTTDNNFLGSSFRDPAGYLYVDSKGEIYRQINEPGFADYDLLMKSGLYNTLKKDGLLISHTEKKSIRPKTKLVKPLKINFISYPYEWSFSQLKDAALLTLKIQKAALKKGLILKDASAYNIQFYKGKPIFIDTLSFEKYQPGQPWPAYRQFCQHFLAPLSLMAYTDMSLSQLFRVFIDGVPLDLANKLLPLKARLKPGIYMHIVLHSKAQQAKAGSQTKPSRAVSQKNLEAILLNLENSINKLQLKTMRTEWGDYYNNTNYTVASADQKAKLIKNFAKPLKVKSAIDFGGNNGKYSRVLNEIGADTICCDIDPIAVEANYLHTKAKKETSMLPVLIDLANPGGAIGWANEERETIDQRFKTDLLLALALIHHLAISNNLPLSKIAENFSKFSPYLIIEFVPKEDSQVKKLLSTRKDIFSSYNEAGFKKAFGVYFKLLKEQKITGTKRTLYLFERRKNL